MESCQAEDGGVPSFDFLVLLGHHHEDVLANDNVDAFIQMIDEQVKYDPLRMKTGHSELGLFLLIVCSHSAVKCASALVNNETKLTVDVNFHYNWLYYPLHSAAKCGVPGITELYMYHGAKTNCRVPHSSSAQNLVGLLPLHLAFNRIKNRHGVAHDWTAKHSIFQLLTLLCIRDARRFLETLEILAWNTEETEQEFLQFARDGKIVEVAALLLVARRKLTRGIGIIRRCMIGYVDGNNEAKQHLPLLLDVFDKAGDCLEKYVKADSYQDSKAVMIEEVKEMFRQAGFDADYDMKSFKWCGPYIGSCYSYGPLAGRTKHVSKPVDYKMKHYGYSGHRWIQKDSSSGSNKKREVVAMEERIAASPGTSAPASVRCHQQIPNVSMVQRTKMESMKKKMGKGRRVSGKT